MEGDWLTLDFPSRPPAPAEAPPEVLAGIPATPLAVLKARDYLLVLPDEAAVRGLRPDRALLDRVNLDPGGICVTAPGDTVDFVSRYFTPQAALFEDPVTGSAHCSLIPYWAARLGRDDLEALQVSPRCGRLRCREPGGRGAHLRTGRDLPGRDPCHLTLQDQQCHGILIGLVLGPESAPHRSGGAAQASFARMSCTQ